MSLSDFVKWELEESAQRPNMREWLKLTRNLKTIPVARSGAQIVRKLRNAR